MPRKATKTLTKKATARKPSKKKVVAQKAPRRNWTDPVTGHALFPCAVEGHFVTAAQKINNAIHDATRQSHEDLWAYCKEVGMSTSEYLITVESLTKWMDAFYKDAQKNLNKAIKSKHRRKIIEVVPIRDVKKRKDIGYVEIDNKVMSSWLEWRSEV